MPTNNVTASNLSASTASLGVPSFSPPVILSDYVLDFGMSTFHNNCDRIYVCTGPITDFASVTATAVGYKLFGAGNAFGGVNNGSPSGRVVSSISFTDGSITANGLAICWAAVDFANSNLLAWGVLAGDVSVIAGQLFGLPSFVIHEQGYFSGSGIVIQCQPASSLATGASNFTRSPLISPLLSASALATLAAGLIAPLANVGHALTAFSFQPTHTDALGTPALAGGGPYALVPTSLAAARAALGTPVLGIVGATQYLDGFTGAPIVSTGPQYPNLLNMYKSTGVAWAWKVAGVDYPVGCATNITLKDPSVQANLPTGATANASGKVVNITGANVTLDGYQFPNDWSINVTTATGTCTISNCRLKGTLGATLQQISHNASGCSLVIRNCEIDQSKVASASDPSNAAGIDVSVACPSVSIQYCWLHGIMIDAIGMNLNSVGTIPSIDCRYNVIAGVGYAGPLLPADIGHPDAMQLLNLNSSNIVWAFNTQFSETGNYAQSNPAIMFESQLGGVLTNGLIANNTIVLGTGGIANYSVCTMFFLETGGGGLDNMVCVNNMMDRRSTTLDDIYTPSTGPTHMFFNNNKDFASGTAVDSEPAASYGTFNTTNDILSATTAAPTSGTIATGQSVVFTVKFNRFITPSGTPQLTLSNGARANYSGGGGTRNLTFTYTVASNDSSSTGLNVVSLVLNGGTLRDTTCGNNVLLTGVAASFASIIVSAGAATSNLLANSLAVAAIGYTKPSLIAGGRVQLTATTLAAKAAGLGTPGATSGTNAPVVTPVSFTLADPVSNDELVGTINATNTPTSWAISGTGSTYFAIYLQGDGSAHLRTAVSGTVAPDGTYNLLTTASNATGTSAQVNIPVQVGSGAGSVPVISTTSFTMVDPVTNSEVVGTVSASGSPTSFTITAGNGSGYFVISNAGVLTVRASSTVPPDGSYSLSVTATNAIGTSSPATIGITVQAAVSGGAVPMPSLTTGTGKAQRPVYSAPNLTWQGPVGGGPSNGTYTTQSQALTTSGSVTTTTAGQVIQNLYITGNPSVHVNHNNVTIRRCFLQLPANSGDAYCVDITSGVTGTIVEDCYLDANMVGSSQVEANGIGCSSNFAINQVTARRNYFYRCGQCVKYTLNNLSFTENYSATWSGGDADCVECYPNGGTCNNLLIQYNYFIGPDNSVNGGNSAINMTTGSGLPVGNIGPNITIDSNWMVRTETTQADAWQYHYICNDKSSGGSLAFTLTNNGFFSAKAGAVWWSSTDGTITHHGNYVMSSATSNTGAAID